MGSAPVHLDVMRRTTHPGRTRPRDPAERYSLRRTLAVTAVLATAVVVGTLAVLHPTAAFVAAAAAAGLAVLARPATRALRHRLRDRRREGRSREVCVPATGVCVEA